MRPEALTRAWKRLQTAAKSGQKPTAKTATKSLGKSSRSCACRSLPDPLPNFALAVRALAAVPGFAAFAFAATLLLLFPLLLVIGWLPWMVLAA